MPDFVDYFYLNEFLNFFGTCIEYILSYISSNRFVFCCFVLPIAVVVVGVVIDFIFDIRDDFTSFHRLHDYDIAKKYKLNFFRSKSKNKNNLDMDEVYRKSRENSDYKHNQRMKEMQYFRENENLRHQHKIEEQNNYKNNSKVNKQSVPKAPVKKKVNLDIEVED